MNEAPLFVQSYDLVKWLLRHYREHVHFPSLTRALVEDADGVLCAVTLALRHLDLRTQLLAADMHLARLRVHLRLAAELETLTSEQYEFTSRMVEEIGRQLGGWQKRVNRI